jgi:hypothetical protein
VLAGVEIAPVGIFQHDNLLDILADLSALAISGAIVGVAAWTLLAPNSHSSGAAVLFIAINCSLWLGYLALTHQMSDAEFQEIEKERAAREAREAEGYFEEIHGGLPSVIAGREVDHWSVPLKRLSGPAIVFAEYYVGRQRHRHRPPTRKESYWIAAIGFVLSTAWWTTVGTAVPWIHQVLRRRRRKRL